MHPTMQKQGTVVGAFSLIHRSAYVGPTYSRLGPVEIRDFCALHHLRNNPEHGRNNNIR